MNELLSVIWGIAAIATITVLYDCWRGVRRVLDRLEAVDDRLNRFEVSLHQFHERFDALNAALQRLAREAASQDRLRQSAQPVLRHDGAMRDAREGMSADELARQHGISHAEARLIVSLHGSQRAATDAIHAG